MELSPLAWARSFRLWLQAPPRLPKCLLLVLALYRVALAMAFPVFSDPATYFIYAKAWARDPGLYLQPGVWFPPPLVPGLGALLWPWAGEVGLKAIAPLFGILAMVYTYRLGRDLYSERVGLAGALLLGIFPAHLHYSALGYLDAPVTAFCVMALFHVRRALENGSTPDALLAGAAAGLAALSKETGPIAGAFILFYLVLRAVHRRRAEGRVLRMALLALLVAGIVASPHVGRNLLFYNDLGIARSTGVPGLTSPQSPDPGDANQEFLLGISAVYGDLSAAGAVPLLSQNYLEAWGLPSGRLDVIPLPSVLLGLYIASTFLFLALLISGLARALRHPSRLLWMWLALWGLAILAVPQELLYSFRRLLPVAPPLALFAALGWEHLRGRLSPRKTLSVALSILLVLAGTAAAATEAGKAAVGLSYYQTRQEPLSFLRSLPENATVMAPDADLVDYYSERVSLHLPQWRPESIHADTLRRLGVTHVVTDDGYLWYDLSPYRRSMEREVEQGNARLAFTTGPVRVYEVLP